MLASFPAWSNSAYFSPKDTSSRCWQACVKVMTSTAKLAMDVTWRLVEVLHGRQPHLPASYTLPVVYMGRKRSS